VSSILNALKKLDKKSQPQKTDQPWTQIDTKEAINHRVKRFRLLSRLVSGLVIVVIAVAGTWLVLSQKQVLTEKFSAEAPLSAEKEKNAPPVPATEKKAESKMPDAQPAVPVNVPEKIVTDEKTAPIPATQQQPPAIPVNLPEKAAKMPDLPETKPTPQPPPVSVSEKMPVPNTVPKAVSPPGPTPGVSETQAQMQKKTSEADAKTKPENPPFLSEEKRAELEMLQSEIDKMMENVTPEQAAELKTIQDEIKHFKKTGKFKQDIESPKPTPPQAAAPEQEASSAKPGDASRLKVQALVWSDDPGSRWAMVNDRIVRTGSSIDGATVTYIGEDHIIVKEGGEEWELKFQIK